MTHDHQADSALESLPGARQADLREDHRREHSTLRQLVRRGRPGLDPKLAASYRGGRRPVDGVYEAKIADGRGVLGRTNPPPSWDAVDPSLWGAIREGASPNSQRRYEAVRASNPRTRRNPASIEDMR